jgi:Ca2+-binding EF-hand superfamily protein
MNKVHIITLGVCAFGLIAASPSFADKANGPKAKFFAKYDTNHNGVIDEDEKAAIRKDYAANPDGDLKRFDKNKDGKLDDEEIAAIKPPSGKKKGEKTDKAGSTTSTNKVDKVEKTEKGAGTVK